MPALKVSRGVLKDITGRANQSSNSSLSPSSMSKTAGTKRKAVEEPPPDYANPDDIDLTGMYMDATCDQIRRKIRNFLDAGDVKKGEFCDAIGVSDHSLNNFLGKNGKMEGCGSDAYGAAWEFFKKRELAGVKPPKKQKATTATSAGSRATVHTSIDLTGICLSGEASDSVHVYDSCDEIRKKINAYLTKPGITQAQFCRDLQAQVHVKQRKIQSKQLSDFRSKKGANAGNTSIVFYTSYVYFEKLRLAEGRPKSKHRQGMEAAHPGGFHTQRSSHNRGYWCPKGAQPVVDAYGLVRIVPGR